MGKRLHGEAACQLTAYPLKMIEQSVIASLLDAAAHPDALAAAVQAYQEEQNATGQGRRPAGLRRERNALEGALKQAEGEEAAAVQAQIAGILAGASPGAYTPPCSPTSPHAVKDLEGRRGTVARLLTGPEKGERRRTKAAGDGPAGEALKDIARVLSSDAVPGQEKRDLVGGLIARVVCQPHGADVFFLPGLGAAQTPASLGAETCNSTLTELMQ